MMQFLRKNVKWIMLIIVILFVVSCFAGYGMYTGGPRSSGGGENDYVVARVDGERVMRSQVESEMEQMIQGMGLAQSVTSEDFTSLRTTVLDQIAILKQLDKEVKSRRITASKDEIDNAVRNIEQSFPTREVFLQQLQAAGLTERGLRSSIEDQVLRQKVFDEVIAVASTDEQEKKTFYDTMKDYAFQKPEGFKVNIAHFGTEDAAEKVRAAIDNDGKWDDVMTAASGDVLSYSAYDSPVLVDITQLTGDFEFLNDQPFNKVTRVVNLGDQDYMLLLKRSKEAAGTALYDEVSADIEQMVVSQKQQGLQSDFLQELREKAVVEILDDTIFSKPEVPETTTPVLSDDEQPNTGAGSADAK
jgi:hypothetical protein